MSEFTELFGFEFGTHGKRSVYLQGRHAEIDIFTGNKTEDLIRMFTGSPTLRGFGPPITAKLVEVATGREVNFNSMFISENNVDPYSEKGSGHKRIPRVPRENAHLLTNTHYRMTLDVPEDAGHPSWVPKMKLTYSGTDTDHDQIVDNRDEGLRMTLEGVNYICYPEE